MKKTVSLLACLSMLLVGSLLIGNREVVRADWWERPTARPTQPSQERNLPTPTQAAPTQPAGQPTATIAPTSPPIGGLPTSAPTPTSTSGGGGEGTSDDPCASDKSYTGPYCGWSPEKDQPTTESGGGEEIRIGGPSVLGLSYTGSGDLKPSDIILLTGVLCLLLYLRSKLPKIESV